RSKVDLKLAFTPGRGLARCHASEPHACRAPGYKLLYLDPQSGSLPCQLFLRFLLNSGPETSYPIGEHCVNMKLTKKAVFCLKSRTAVPRISVSLGLIEDK